MAKFKIKFEVQSNGGVTEAGADISGEAPDSLLNMSEEEQPGSLVNQGRPFHQHLLLAESGL